MTPERLNRPGVAMLAVVGMALCCGLPILLSLAAGIALIGIGLRTWVLVVAGLVAMVAAFLAWRRRRSPRPEPGPGARTPPTPL